MSDSIQISPKSITASSLHSQASVVSQSQVSSQIGKDILNDYRNLYETVKQTYHTDDLTTRRFITTFQKMKKIEKTNARASARAYLTIIQNESDIYAAGFVKAHFQYKKPACEADQYARCLENVRQASKLGQTYVSAFCYYIFSKELSSDKALFYALKHSQLLHAGYSQEFVKTFINSFDQLQISDSQRMIYTKAFIEIKEKGFNESYAKDYATLWAFFGNKTSENFCHEFTSYMCEAMDFIPKSLSPQEKLFKIAFAKARYFYSAKGIDPKQYATTAALAIRDKTAQNFDEAIFWANMEHFSLIGINLMKQILCFYRKKVRQGHPKKEAKLCAIIRGCFEVAEQDSFKIAAYITSDDKKKNEPFKDFKLLDKFEFLSHLYENDSENTQDSSDKVVKKPRLDSEKEEEEDSEGLLPFLSRELSLSLQRSSSVELICSPFINAAMFEQTEEGESSLSEELESHDSPSFNLERSLSVQSDDVNYIFSLKRNATEDDIIDWL